MAEGIAKRVAALRAELDRESAHYRRLGRRSYRWQILLMLATVGSSILAAVLGLGFDVDPRIVGGIALIPGICAGIADKFRLAGKTNWFYRKHDALKALLRQVDYITPLEPSAAQVAEIAAAFSQVEGDMSAAWQNFEFEDRGGAAKPAEG